MIISVFSPHTGNNGNTVSAILLSMGLADMKRNIVLTHTNPNSPSFYKYLGLSSVEDKTSTPSQLVKLLNQGAIKPDEIVDYCKGVNEYLYAFTSNSEAFSEKDMGVMLQYLCDNKISEYTVVDVDSDYTSTNAELVLRKSDVVILNFNPSYKEVDDFNLIKDKVMKICKDKIVILLCNRYVESACKLKDFSARLGANVRCYIIHNNRYVPWGCNDGKLYEVYKKAKIKDYRTIELNKDIMTLTKAISKINIAKKKQKSKEAFKSTNVAKEAKKKW